MLLTSPEQHELLLNKCHEFPGSTRPQSTEVTWGPKWTTKVTAEPLDVEGVLKGPQPRSHRSQQASNCWRRRTGSHAARDTRPGRGEAAVRSAPAGSAAAQSTPHPHHPPHTADQNLPANSRGPQRPGTRKICHLHFLLSSLLATFRQALVLADRHGADRRAKRAEVQLARELNANRAGSAVYVTLALSPFLLS